MYKLEEDIIFTEELIDKVKVTPEIIKLADVFKQKISFDKLSKRATKLLQNNSCETIGDAYYFVTYNRDSIGIKTTREIMFYVLHVFMPCKYAVEVRKAFLLSQKNAETAINYGTGDK